MVQTASNLRPASGNVWQLRRKKVPDEISLPADYVPTDYTSLPPEEPKKSGSGRIIIGAIAAILVLGAIAYAVLFMNKTDPPAPTEVPLAKIEISRALMIVSNNKLTTQIDATTDAPEGSEVTATLLEDDKEFAFWDAAATKQTVSGGAVKFSLTEADQHENGRKSSTYKVRLSVNGATQEKELEIAPSAMDRFTGAGSAIPIPTPTVTVAAPSGETAVPTSPPAEVPTPTTAIGAKPVPVPNVVISRPGIVYGSPYGPALQRGNVNTGDLSTIVVKLPVSGEVWYLLVVPNTGVAGWVNSSVVDLPASEVNKITPVTGDAPYAVVFNGGNMRTAPGGAVVTQVDAGLNVKLTSRLADNSWFKIELADGQAGWVSGQLLTINPTVINTVPVAP